MATKGKEGQQWNLIAQLSNVEGKRRGWRENSGSQEQRNRKRKKIVPALTLKLERLKRSCDNRAPGHAGKFADAISLGVREQEWTDGSIQAAASRPTRMGKFLKETNLV